MTKEDKEIFSLQANPKWRVLVNNYCYPVLRGRTLADLVCMFQDARDTIEQGIYWAIPSWFEGSQEDYDNLQRYYHTELMKNIIAEVERRTRIKDMGMQNTNKEIIAAIKERVDLATVLEWYTEVFYSGKSQWKFRCTLHGEDRTPSGLIYVEEKRWHCFACQKGGDIFDAVQAFERVDLARAIGKLSRYCGIDTRALVTKPMPTIRGGANL